MKWLRNLWTSIKYWTCRIMEEKIYFEGFEEGIAAADVLTIIFDVYEIPDGQKDPEPIIIIILKNGANIKLKASDVNVSNARIILSLKKKYSI